MRGILFRGKRKDNGEWVYGWYAPLVCNDRTEIPSIIDFIGIDWRVEPKTIGQFTGRWDEDCNKIFEGDILEVSYDDGTAYATEVRAYGSTLCVDIEGEDYDFTAIDFAIDIWKDNCCECKVIGNVFDNPELLEEL